MAFHLLQRSFYKYSYIIQNKEEIRIDWAAGNSKNEKGMSAAIFICHDFFYFIGLNVILRNESFTVHINIWLKNGDMIDADIYAIIDWL